ncbi:unnamed protein product [Symbiodinium sp. CCMP2592]|nr:unnamed protein product [Symbiodinium sp. CCMP2592]
MASWNLGGQSLPKADVVSGALDLLCVQEVPRSEPGWREDTTDGFTWLLHQSSIQWRGVGIGVSHDLFDCTTDRRSCSHGAAWVVRLRNAKRFVLASLHLPTGVPVQEYYKACSNFRSMLAGWHSDLPCVVGVDANVELIWSRADDREDGVGLQSGGKVDKFLEMCGCLRLQPQAPRVEDRWVPTHYPRDESRDGRHIDCLLVRGLASSPVLVDSEVRLHINTDHARLHCRVELQKTRGGRWRDGRARWVCDSDKLFEPETWEDVKRMAHLYTRPRPAVRFKDDAETLDMIHDAKAARGIIAKDLWKKVHAMRKKKRRDWKQNRVLSILGGNWHAYRDYKKERGRRNWWGRLLQDTPACELGDKVAQHLKNKVHDDGIDWHSDLSARLDAVECPDSSFRPISCEEVSAALTGMRARSALGPDLVGVDLLRKIFEFAPQALCALFNEVLHSGVLPEDWDVSLLALLPKTAWPAGVADLRPIAMSSASMKTLSRIIMSRTFPAMRRPCPWTAAGCGRSCADMHGTFSRLRDMSREWRVGVIAVKLDIRGAFDHVHRRAVADFITTHLQGEDVPFETRFLLRLLDVNRLEGCAPGGARLSVDCNRGIRQGSPESAEIFGLLVSCIISRLKSGNQWRVPNGLLQDLPADVGCYQDDIFVWGEQSGPISHNIGLISQALREVGLELAREKTSIIASKYYKGVRYVVVDGLRVEMQPPGSSIRVLGLDFDFDAPAHQQTKEVMGKVWTAFHANKTLLCGPGSRAAKVYLVRMLIEGCWSWTAGSLHWEKDDLRAMNSLQLRVLRLCFRCPRREGEDWVSYNSRSLRDLRSWVCNNGTERWSSKILRLQFQLMGHWSRRWEGGVRCLAGRMQLWRCLAWWQTEQTFTPAAGGKRHPRCFRASNLERSLATALGVNWPVAAANRDGWRQLLKTWLDAEDVQWCSGRQAAIGA